MRPDFIVAAGLNHQAVALAGAQMHVANGNAAAARFHLLSGDHPVLAVPAALCGTGAAAGFLRFTENTG